MTIVKSKREKKRMFRVMTQNLYEAEDRLWQQIRRKDDLRSTVLSVLYEIKRMEPMEEECRELGMILERMDTEVRQLLDMAQALASIREMYTRCDDSAVIHGEDSISYIRNRSISTIELPEYDDRLIRQA